MLGNTDWKAMLGEVRRSVTWFVEVYACVAPEVTLMETERTESQAQGPSQGTHAGRQSPGEEGA